MPVTARADGATDVIRNAEGTLVVSGWVDFGGDEDFVVPRYLENGTLDPDCGTGGVSAAPISSASTASTRRSRSPRSSTPS